MASLESRIQQCMLADQGRFMRRLRRLEKGAARPDDRPAGLAGLRAEIEQSERRRSERQRSLPKPDYPPALPISAQVEAIADAIRANPVVIVCGETGSGKTTQIPKICLSIGRGAAGLIGHTQPRRVAARSTAARIAVELGTSLGDKVGYKLRFDQRVGKACYLKVLTDGMLLAEIQADRDLAAYDTIIIDEAHERSLNIDFLLGYLKRLLARRTDLKLVISSATIDTARFSEFFEGAPVIEVSGRGYPVELRYQPVEATAGAELDLHDHIVATVEQLCDEGPGDVLVFLPGERDIRELLQTLRRRLGESCEILPVYARLPLAQQQRLFEPRGKRRMVLATNVAETSITVPDIRYVIDPGLARISRFGRRGSVQRLPVEPISRASADQRMGRCGRTAPGVCVRLYSEEDYLGRPEFTEPEIRRTNLAAVLLSMRALGIHDLEAFPFLDAPDRRRVNDGYRLLRELGAIDAADALTAIGRRLARLPVDPPIGRMILAAEEFDCLAQVLVIASALSVADPRERPPDAEAAAALAHQRYQDDRSDFMGLLSLWDYVHEQTRGLGAGASKAFCRKRFLSLPRLREWQEVHRQLKEIVRDMGLRPRRHETSYSRIHRALLTGLLRNIGMRNADGAYDGLHDTVFHLSSQSGQARREARWVMAAELVETSRLYAHQVARIRTEWIERAAGDLLRRAYFDAHWDPRRGEVMVYEQTSLHGLTVTPRRRVRLAPVSRADAHAIFVQSAIMDRTLASPAGFLKKNAEVVDGLRRYEHKLRRPDVLVADDDVYAFYMSLIPEDVCDSKSFEAWRRRAEREDPEHLLMDAEQLMRGRLPESAGHDFPDTLEFEQQRLALVYRFDPGRQDDGVTLEIPLELLPRLRVEPCEWLVPGLLEEKVLAMLRLLPKTSRRELLPLNDCARDFMAEGARGSGSLANALRAFLRARRGVDVPADAWQRARLESKLAPHLLMNFRVIDADGRCLDQSRDLPRLQARLAAQPPAPPPAARSGYPREGLRGWVVDDLPTLVETHVDGRLLRGYPALADRGESVALDLFPSAEAAAEAHAAGVRRLYAQRITRTTRRMLHELPNLAAMELMHSVLPAPPGYLQADRAAPDGLAGTIVDRAIERAMADAGAIRDEAAFQAAAAEADALLPAVMASLAAQILGILEEHRSLVALRREQGSALPGASLDDIDRQMAHLVFRGFVRLVPDDALAAYPRYLAGLRVRLDKLCRGGAGDGRKLAEVMPLWDRFAVRASEHASRGHRDAELARYRWMLEEYRISLFAQELGTAYRISAKRLEEQWRKVSL
ncbi:MAG: ATP-dependent RNA helicase HrpA [Gammaproteobacteria bacterium]|nr:ATP-dependent RNA helicase HrpA [Gammaproteobacteria bacterium]NIN37420.1 ATP-dependent RNA helicase HrpA [Gammaproteobacteria bacterium]NIO26276.1 ATP-dependent RNA helicase HrpA [Gammaproteobacteria bacterium]NIO66828.1 ATP-dependent RNA helicase HrpA [Gammaproteobacteria bacterium]NIP87966.1 ATP-dependent RNA helicase HrpA [Gammaproteobacteria bacterium]